MERKIEHGLLHCHTENSMKDSAMSVKTLVARARQYGAPAVLLSDHGTMTGVFELFREAAKINENKDDPWYGIYDIKPIPGVEAYVQESADPTRQHLLLIAKNYAGYKAISRAVTKSNSNIRGERPCMTMAMLEEFFGPNSPGHGNVIATSACAGGVLAQILLKNGTINSEIDKLKRKQARYDDPESPSYTGNMKLLEQYHNEVEILLARRDELKKTADMKFGRWERTIAKMIGPEKEAAEADLAEKKKARDKAEEDLALVKSELAKVKRRETEVKRACHDAEKSHEKWFFYQKEIEKLSVGLRSETELYNESKSMAIKYSSVFGSGNFFVELQYHGIQDEAKAMPQLARIASELGLPVVACNDIHYADNTPECVRGRALVSAMRYNKWNPEREGDREYYIKTDAELREWLCKILDKETVERAMSGISEIVNACNVIFPTSTHFPKFVGGIEGETAKGRLRRLTEEGIAKRYPEGDFRYRERVEYELGIIDKMQYNDYLCIVQDFLDFARKEGVDNPEQVGYAVGPGRGSAAGSLVCYLIGITSVDPMPLNLLFERFLNPDRVSSPDIDVDLGYSVREKTLNYVRSKYGEEAVCCIMTKGRLTAKAALKGIARVRGSEKFDDKMAFYDLGNALAKMIPNKDTNAKLKDYETAMREAFADNQDAQEIITDAFLIEGTAINYGMHAAGVIIADNGDVGEYIPLMWNDEKTRWCTQCDMVESEEQAGLLKFDFLGLRNLDIITDTLRSIKRNTGKSIDIEKVPQESVIYREIFAAGRTDFVFQFASDGMKNLLRKFKPENLEHLILLNALFRPGPLQYADPICEVKAGKKKPSYICKEAKEVLSITYGYSVYQEQIMQFCNKVAGFSLGESDMVRRFMAKKKVEQLSKFEPKFVKGLEMRGISKEIATNFWKELMDFGKYAFNKSHSAVYATIAYYTAWLKYHYPTEYMTAVLNNSPISELPEMIKECKELGLKIVAPDINRSATTFTGRDRIIMFGLGNIKNVGKGASEILAERDANGTYRSFKDLLIRVRPDKGVCESLIDAGAFDCWCENRVAMKMVLGNLLDDIKKINDKTAVEVSIAAELAALDPEDKKEIAKLQKKLDSTKAKKAEYQERFDLTVLPVSFPEDMSMRLAIESELLGMYISGHPMDEYPEAQKVRTASIRDIKEARYVTLCGVVRNLVIKKRKKDGAPMAFFTLEDETGSVEGCCFTKAYEELSGVFSENAVIAVEGRLSVEEDDETEKSTKKITIEEAHPLQPKPKKILVSVRGLPSWTEDIYPQVVPYSVEAGVHVILYDTMLGEFRETDLSVSKDILLAEIDGAELSEVDI